MQLISNNRTSCSSINIPKNTPAITIVEGCNNAGIGVGADIAFDSQLKKGNWADLEKIMVMVGAAGVVVVAAAGDAAVGVGAAGSIDPAAAHGNENQNKHNTILNTNLNIVYDKEAW